MTFSMLGHTNPIELVVYYGAQVTGCIMGALWLALMVPWLHIRQQKNLEYDGCFVPNSQLNLASIVGFEALGTFLFILPVFSVVWYTQYKHGYGTTGPLMVGLSLLASALGVGNFTGAALNPARVLGSYIVFGCVSGTQVGCYIAGEILGAIAASLVILPWYGIANKPWYMPYIGQRIASILKYYQPSIELQTANEILDNRISSKRFSSIPQSV